MRYEREYLGVTITKENYRDVLNKEGRYGINYHTKHLRAYLKGKTTFVHDFYRDENGKPRRDNWGRLLPIQHRVQSTLREIVP